MTLDEFIVHTENVATRKLRESDKCFRHGGSAYIECGESLRECSVEHRQLAEWLKELKAYREADTPQTDLLVKTPRKSRESHEKKKEVEWVYNKRERLWYPYSNGEPLFKTENSSEKPNSCDTCRKKGFEGCEQPCLGCGCCGLHEPKDEPQTEDAYAYDEDDWYDKTERSE